MAAKKKKTKTALRSFRNPAATMPILPTKAVTDNEAKPEAQIETPQHIPSTTETNEDSNPAEDHGLIQGPTILEGADADGHPGWDSDLGLDDEAFVDDDMDFLPIGWGNNDKGVGKDEDRAEFAEKAKLKRKKVWMSAIMETSSTLSVSLQAKNGGVASEIKTTSTRILRTESSQTRVQTKQLSTAVTRSSAIGNQTLLASYPEKHRVEWSVEHGISMDKPTPAGQNLSSEKVTEKLARQERDLKSAKTQAASLRAEIKLLADKHNIELKRQVSELEEKHQQEMDIMKNDLAREVEAHERISTVLRKAREKDSRIRGEKTNMDGELKATLVQMDKMKRSNDALNLRTTMLDASVAALKQSTSDAHAEREAIKRNLEAERAYSRSLEQQLSTLRIEHRRILTQQRSASGASHSITNRLQEMEEKYDNLKDDYWSLRDKYGKLRDEASEDRSDRRRYKSDAPTSTNLIHQCAGPHINFVLP